MIKGSALHRQLRPRLKQEQVAMIPTSTVQPHLLTPFAILSIDHVPSALWSLTLLEHFQLIRGSLSNGDRV